MTGKNKFVLEKNTTTIESAYNMIVQIVEEESE